MFVTALALLATFVSSVIAFWYLNWYYYTKGIKNCVGPKPIPILGNALDFKGSDSFLPYQIELQQKYGGFVRMIMGFDVIFVVSDYKLLEFFFSTTVANDKANAYRFFHRWLGLGLLTSGGTKWKKRRRMITPAYHFQILDQFIETFDKNAGILVQQLRKEVGSSRTDIYPHVTLCALDIICETAMGSSVNAQLNKETEYVQSVKKMCKIVVERSFSALQRKDFYYRFHENYLIEKNALKVLHDYTMSVIKSRRETLMENQVEDESNNETDDLGKKKRFAFLDLLLQSSIDGKPLTDEDIREEVDTFMFEGHDTTTSAISFALYSIAQNYEVQNKIIEEQKLIFGDDFDRVPTHRDLQEMKYLDLVIKETLRMYPSVPFFGRSIAKDCKYSEDLKFKKGTQINLFIYGIHYNPEYYPDPYKFDPERFSPERSLGNNPYSYVPFSAGARNCIGQKFAILEMKSTISKVVKNFVLHPVVPAHKLDLVAETILKSTNGILVRLEDRY